MKVHDTTELGTNHITVFEGVNGSYTLAVSKTN